MEYQYDWHLTRLIFAPSAFEALFTGTRHSISVIFMAPSAIPLASETASELVSAGVKEAVAETAPSIVVNGSHSTLSELDASKLIFIRNLNPRPIPEPGSPEVWSQNVYEMTPFQWRKSGAIASKREAKCRR